ncbi:hypothetical protein J4Q44_G00275340 [Coregonus suidteri]|uniref:Uncharacterized protein n=1 Tax=Coregonus suidteri TaxID=861788 RepID=A0AAN8LAD3_9TELE
MKKKKKVTEAMRGVDHIATTTDCWSARRRSFIGVTAHWIDPDSLNRWSAVLACKRLRGSHTFVLAGALNYIYSEFEICAAAPDCYKVELLVHGCRKTPEDRQRQRRGGRQSSLQRLRGSNPKYAATMSPVAKAINILQAETNVQMGWLLPTINLLITKLDRLKLSLKYCKPLVDALQLGLKKRFSHTFHDPELIAAAILLLKFKTTWTKDDTTIRMVFQEWTTSRTTWKNPCCS